MRGKVGMILVQITDINETFRDADFKDERPLKTVERIKGILKDHGIETEESWMDSGVPYCYSLRIAVSGTTFSTNGKGLTKEFALASGYGELMERLQLGYVGSVDVQKSGDYTDEDSRDVMVSTEELLCCNKKWYEAFSKQLLKYSGIQMSPEDILMQYADANGSVRTIPYFNITSGGKVFFPTKLGKRIYTTNGCAAGNTIEEAIVQGISEIVERHYKMKILTEVIAVPDIPEEALKKYKAAYDIITYVRSKGFRVHIKDCSLGTKFPVVCACFIDEKSGRYHTHFGAYPIFEIALERALTESFQGRNLDNLAKYDSFIYKKSDVYSLDNIASEMQVGIAEKLPDFFVGKTQYEWREGVGFSGNNNRELLREVISFFAEQGHDIIVRNGSCLGFPTCQVLIPGYSEVFVHRLSRKQDEFRYSAYAMKTLRNPPAAGMEDMMGLLMHTNQMNKLMGNVTGVSNFTAGAKLFAELDGRKERYWMSASLAYVYFALGKYAESLKCVNTMLSLGDKRAEEYLICIKRYLSLRLNGYEEDQTKNILEFFHSPESVKKLYSCLENGGNPLRELTLRCDMSCREDCLLYGNCCHKQVSGLLDLVNQKTAELDFEAFAQSLTQLIQ